MPYIQGLQGVSNFAVRYQGLVSTGTDRVALAAEYAAIDADMVVIEASLAASDPLDKEFSLANIETIRRGSDLTAATSDDKLVIAYMSLGSIRTSRPRYTEDGFSQHVVPSLVPLGPNDEARLKFWEPSLRGSYYQWVSDLIGQGVDGAYLDVLDDYRGLPETGDPDRSP